MRNLARVLLATGAAVSGASAQDPSEPRVTHVIRGIVYDSIAREPLHGAIIQVMMLGADPERTLRLTGMSDTDGRYQIPDLPDGTFMIGFFHPKLDSLGIEAPVRRIRVPQEADRAMDLSVPSAATVVTSTCGQHALRDSTGLVAGYVLRPEDGGIREGAQVLARWSEIILDKSGARAATREVTAVTGPTGWFGLCGVPNNAVVLLRVAAAADTGSFVELEVPPHGVLLRGLFLSDQHIARPTDDDRGRVATDMMSDSIGRRVEPASATTVTRDGRVRLTGVVRSRSGEPVPSARVSIWGSRYSATTNADGEYAIGDIPPGSHTLEVRAIGFVPSRTAVDLFAQQPMRADVSMTDFPTEIDAVRVFASRPKPATSPGSFEYRRKQGYGTFLDAEQIERRAPQQFSDLLRATRGVQVSTSGASGTQILMEGNSPKVVCEPLLVLDGQHVPLHGMNINDLIPSHIVRAVEIYPRRMEAPPEFQSLECGTIVVWTGARGWLAKRNKAPVRKPKDKT